MDPKEYKLRLKYLSYRIHYKVREAVMPYKYRKMWEDGNRIRETKLNKEIEKAELEYDQVFVSGGAAHLLKNPQLASASDKMVVLLPKEVSSFVQYLDDTDGYFDSHYN